MGANYYLGAPAHLRTDQRAVLRSQERCDAIQAAYRNETNRRPLRREAPPIPPALTPTDDALSLRLAEEFEYARRLLDSMGDEFSSDPALLMRHSVPLQSIDIVGQILGHVAAVVRSSDPDGAVDRIGMCELKARLVRSGIA
ncbi:MAG: hypothetical protein ABIS39_02725 [Sphingomicrobium sp.]